LAVAKKIPDIGESVALQLLMAKNAGIVEWKEAEFLAM